MTDRDQLLAKYGGIVQATAWQMNLPAHVEREDLVAAGVVGLLDAWDRFDVSRGLKFETYAFVRVRGAMIDHLRSLDWLSRSTRKNLRARDQAAAALEAELGRTANDHELAAAADLPVGEIRRLARLEVQPISLDHAPSGLEDEDAQLGDVVVDQGAVDPSEGIERAWRSKRVARVLNRLPEQERLTLTLCYFEELSLAEIATVFGLSGGRISQLHASALRRVRGRLVEAA